MIYLIFFITHTRMDSLPWTEKYRPTDLKTCVGNVGKQLQALASLSIHEIPHLILHGPPGTGKNTYIKNVFTLLYGKDYLRYCSFIQERSIQYIRKHAPLWKRTHNNGFPSFIVFNEADKMSLEAQEALRRRLEMDSKSVRYCFICNDISKIILPLQSRAQMFYFEPLTLKDISHYIQNITKEEKITLSSPLLAFMVSIAEGDLRRVINLLYACFMFQGSTITRDAIVFCSGYVPDSEWNEMLALSSIKASFHFATCCYEKNYDWKLLYLRIHEYTTENKKICKLIPQKKRASFYLHIIQLDFQYVEGFHSLLLFHSLIESFYVNILSCKQQC
jgi:replication factor C subunit 3/5